ncbi:TetR/AcrR family transcriptional regulator [Loktanella sp. DJP18]|uniref:TetR/AcrR family transcriptional regulator n=1 Tax=Loktanella sp. DJP18 TaxID=3409788 RepID=UPI003BB806BA
MSVSEVLKAPRAKRLRMAPDARRADILDAALALFYSRGWDHVTVADVLQEADISKGGFYHHFNAKEDLLDGLIERFTTEALAAAQDARDATSGTAIDRFNAFLAETCRWKAERVPQIKFLIDVMLRPGNDALFQRITAATNAAARPVLRDMILQGVADGSFDVPDVALVSETIVGMSNGRRKHLLDAVDDIGKGDLEAAAARLDQRMAAEAALIGRLLGLAPGTITLGNPSEHRLMLQAIATS